MAMLDRCRPYTQVTVDGVVSHVTAAQIHGLVLPNRLAGRPVIDLARPRGKSNVRRRHVVGHRLELGEGEVVLVAGVPVTSVARTWLDLASVLGLDDLVAMGDQIVNEHHRNFGPRKVALVPLAKLQEYVASKRCVRGIAKARAALALVRVGVDSPRETRVRLMLQRAGLPEFVPDHPIRNERGEPDVWPDLACDEFRTCVEYEGMHHLTVGQQASDHDRDFRTRQLGWHQARINDDDMRAGSAVVVAKVARMLVRGGWPDPNSVDPNNTDPNGTAGRVARRKRAGV
ncbi:hypothetical protein [Specibacter cremeus]|uniref:hypothetical protein n=1 Tax=Specibacter cremeus TaxID=1629051 RepID=UPI00197B6181|nr:hypothetical protein [Specibacter cremeus]